MTLRLWALSQCINISPYSKACKFIIYLGSCSIERKDSMNNSENRFWPYKPRSSIVSAILISFGLLLTVAILKETMKWPSEQSETAVLVGVLVFSLLPVLLALDAVLRVRGKILTKKFSVFRCDESRESKEKATTLHYRCPPPRVLNVPIPVAIKKVFTTKTFSSIFDLSLSKNKIINNNKINDRKTEYILAPPTAGLFHQLNAEYEKVFAESVDFVRQVENGTALFSNLRKVIIKQRPARISVPSKIFR